MDKLQSHKIVEDTFQNQFDKERFVFFIKNLLNNIDESKAFHAHGYVKHQYKQTVGIVKTYERIGSYIDTDGKKIDLLIVYLEKENSIDRARTTLRNFVADYLKQRDQKDAALVAFVSPNFDDWRFSLVKMDYRFEEGTNGKMKVKEEFTPARRWSFLVGKNENSHTAKSRLAPLVENENQLSLTQLEESFNIEKVTKEFFEKYRDLFLRLKENLDDLLSSDPKIKQDFAEKEIESVDFTKKLLGQIVFLYFLQKKGWFGVDRDAVWGTGPKDFLRQLFQKKHGEYKNFFNEILEPLFYEALAKERDDNYYGRFNCKVPFLNGGLFDPIGGYDWVHTDIVFDNDVFSNNRKTKEGDIGDGILDIFDRYNFTVREDEPLEKEVAVDPEMLGKVFENLLEVKDRKSKGTYYTPREIVHYMCEQSLINYLATEIPEIDKTEIEDYIKIGEQVLEHEYLIVQSDEIEVDKFKISSSIIAHAELIDQKLANIKVCDPAIGSGAFPVGMMNEIVTARLVLNPYIDKENRAAYDFKLQAITNSLYGVDIDPGAAEIAKLRLWLSLIVDENDIKKIHPLPNLDYKIMQGNSLLEEFEGIQLFDESIIPQEKADNNSVKLAAEKKISELSKEFIQLHTTHKLSKAEEIRIKDQIKVQQKFIKSLIDKPKTNMAVGLFDNHDEIRKKWDELTNLHKRIVNEYHKKEKETMLKRASDLEWEFIEATLRSESRLDSIKKIEQFKKKNTKPFFLWHLHFADVFQSKGGFDVVIANPPYVNISNLKEDDRYSYKKVFTITKNKVDLYAYFIEKGASLLSKNSTLCYIIPHTWKATSSFEKLRQFIFNNFQLQSVVELQYGTFDATVKPVVIVLKKPSVKDYFIEVFDQNFQTINRLPASKILRSNDYTVDTTSSQREKDVFSKIESQTINLQNILKFTRGVKTSNDARFVKGLNDNDECRKVIRGRNVQKYTYTWNGEYIWYRPDLMKEKTGCLPHNKGLFEVSEKIILQRISKGLVGCLDINKIYALDTCLVSDINTHNKKFTLKYILALINSSTLNYWYRRKFILPTVSGYELEQLPLKEITTEKQQQFIEIVDKILSVTKSSDYLTNPAKQAEVQGLESRIDQMVYRLYDLTPEEIKIVEAS